MRVARSINLLLITLAFTGTMALAQTRETGTATASISGRVMAGGKPLPDVVVVLSQSGAPRINNRITALARATTDEEGRFRLTNLGAGKYVITPIAAAFIVAREAGNSWEEGKAVTLADGDEVEGVDFTLKRGGVITGRVTDANNQPLIDTNVSLIQIDERGTSRNYSVYDYMRTLTDDRGIYRIYGLPAGRYKVSVGFQVTEGFIRVGTGAGFYQRTFYPNVMQEARAEIVELAEGGEAGNIDIAVGLPLKTYQARGRIINADTGRPVTNQQFGYGSISQGERGVQTMGAMGMTGNRTNARGEFILEGVLPGRYAAFAVIDENSDDYSDTVTFEVKDADVSGLEIKMRRGSSISGVVAIEGVSDAEARDLMTKFTIGYQMNPRGMDAWRMATIRPAPDGSFKIAGMRAGRVQITPQITQTPGKNLSLMRVEQNGADVKDGVEVKEGEPVTGVRVVLAYGTGIVRGRVTFEEGAKIAGGSYRVVLRLPGGEGRFMNFGNLDDNGRFVIDSVPSGEYELLFMMYQYSGPGKRPEIPIRTIQKVTVTNGAESQITYVVKANADERDK